MTDPRLVPVTERPSVLVVAGLDPTGGAGVTLDAAVARAFHVHPVVAQTGVAVQSSTRFVQRHDVPVDLLTRQLDTLAEEFRLGAVKVGMVPTPGLMTALAQWLEQRPRLPVVLDPVGRSTSGGVLSEDSAQAILRERLLPRARIVTPNLDEAAALSGLPVSGREDMLAAAERLRGLGAQWVLVKGGHLPRDRGTDLLAGPDGAEWLEVPPRPAPAPRGTGCALSTAIACGLARTETVPTSVRDAKRFLTRALDAAYVAGEARLLGVAAAGEGAEPS